MKLRRIITLATAGTAAASISLFGLGTPAAHADSDQPITFEVGEGGALALAQDNSGSTALTSGSAVNLPVTTVTDSRNGTVRLWDVTATASALTSGANSILATQITLDETPGSFTTGTGTRVAKAAVVGTGALVSATGDSIDSVFTYTPTAALAAQGNIPAGDYTGNVTQTVL